MRVYKCIFTGDELFTDSYRMETTKGFHKIRGTFITRSEKFDDSKLGANPSAEEQDEGTDDAAVSGIDIVIDNRLQKTCFGTKKEFMVYLKDLCKRLEEIKKENNPNLDVTKWRADVQAAFKEILSDFDNFEFYTGESCNPDGTLAMCKWEIPEGATDDVPFFYFFADGVKEEKF